MIPTELLTAGQVVPVRDSAWITDPDGRVTRLPDGHLLSGYVDVDTGRVWRRECDVRLHPDTSGDLVYPHGQSLTIRRRSWLPSLDVVSIGLGVYRVTGYERDQAGVWHVKGMSRERAVVAADFVAPRILSGRTHVQQIDALLREAVPDAAVSARATRDRIMPVMPVERSRWGAIDDGDASLARAIGAHVYCDRDGTFVIADLPDGSGAPIWTAREGEAVVGWAEKVSEDDTYNVIIATGDRAAESGEVPRGVWWESNPASPRYVGDRAHAVLMGTPVDTVLALPPGALGLGSRVRAWSSPLLETDAQALAAATSMGVAQSGMLRSVQVETVPMWWVDGGEVIDVSVGGVMERHLIEQARIGVGMDAGSSTQMQTRQTRR